MPDRALRLKVLRLRVDSHISRLNASNARQGIKTFNAGELPCALAGRGLNASNARQGIKTATTPAWYSGGTSWGLNASNARQGIKTVQIRRPEVALRPPSV